MIIHSFKPSQVSTARYLSITVLRRREIRKRGKQAKEEWRREASSSPLPPLHFTLPIRQVREAPQRVPPLFTTSSK
jgi:hypothetical protein